ncbi:MAG: hypothetical protein KTR31_38765 [Myxococcales bacterium]|nr:hypothetical protein [Myxococcales bacterium]
MTLARSVAFLIGALAVGCVSENEVRDDFEVDPVDILPCGFTPISGTHWSIYDCNPVFTGTDEPWVEDIISVAFRTESVFGHPVFQVWYSAAMKGYQSWGLGYAVSDDGIEWATHADNPVYGPTFGWDAQRATALTVAWNAAEGEYAITYQGSDLPNDSLGMGVITSTNGVAWREPPAGSRLIDLTAAGNYYCWPLGFTWQPDEGYIGYIAANASNGCHAFRFDADALAPDAINVRPRQALETRSNTRYDAAGATSVATVVLGETHYMFYTGFSGWVPVKTNPNFRRTNDTTLAVATSETGVRWTRDEDNPVPISLNEPGRVGTIGAQAINGRVHVWVTDFYPDLKQKGVGYFLYEPDSDAHP